MSSITIDDMNEVIAQFDGWQYHKGDPDHKCKFCFAGDEPCTPAVDRFIKDCRVLFHYGLKYHSSWDWLHEVWNKFRALNFINHPLVSDYQAHLDRIATYMAYNPISEAHNALYKAIQWYNKQKEANNDQAD